jgi:predicted protein tyrosine phosphatase
MVNRSMIQIHPNLYIGDQMDYEQTVRHKNGWSVVHACKDPYHRDTLGYSGRGAPKHHPEYYFARRKNRIILNLIDPENPKYIPKEIIDETLAFIDEQLAQGQKVLVHCNQGQSRSPGIGLLWLAKEGEINNKTFSDALSEFRGIYPNINMAGGMRGFLEMNWEQYKT